ncbi:hypothetical protein BOTBODRAFT_33451 [Botryobasidium botryosum FD-172 SS1]|uniref:Uncharacterized protein n=1 Tax=Botryobasidium botryosum (strain FD-172 SS1) TaxID=930990 RepID=A0A067MFH3_BOTB1|nr:hypothetical protein BOTBODRAFT_33451 [Botryobasidium botryosum FD-172 SS1]
MASAAPLFLGAPAPAPLASSSLHLMPFHIAHTGPAPISSYFLVKRTPRVTTDVQGEAKLLDEAAHESSLTAAFRGRVMHGRQVDIPASYGGILLAKEGEEDDVAHSNEKKRKAEKAEETSGTRGGKSRKSTGKDNAVVPKGRVTRGRTKTKAREGKDDETDGEGGGPTNSEHVYALMSQVDVEDTPVLEQGSVFISEVDIPEATRDDARYLRPTASFSSFVLWSADVPPDEGQDEYIRAMNEWIKLADIIHEPEVDSNPTPAPAKVEAF